MARIYLDYNATTPVDPRVAEVVLRYMTEIFGNPSSVDHIFGDEAQEAVDQATDEVRRLLCAEDANVVFSSGSTESANLAIRGLAGEIQDKRGEPLRIGLMPVEHPAVLETCQHLATKGNAELSFLQVDRLGRLDLEHLREVCRKGIDLICAMGANNELGTIYPLEEVGRIVHEHGTLFFCDATQAAGKTQLEMEGWGIDLLCISAHKMYGPKGVGALVFGRGITLQRVLTGGSHQHGIRGGTLNVPGIAGLGEACRLRRLEMDVDEPRHASFRDRLQSALLSSIPDLVTNGDLERRLPGTLHVSLPGIPNTGIIARLRDKVAVSTGSACSSGIEAPSHVLRAIGLPESLQAGALRISLGKFTTEEEVTRAASLVADAVTDMRADFP